MTDKELINLIAFTWINHGGDAEGFEWTYIKILKTIRELEGKGDNK